MKHGLLADLARPLALMVLLAAVMLLGAGTSVWATPMQSPSGQSVPTATPGAPAIPQVTPPPAADVAGATVKFFTAGVPLTVPLANGQIVLPANAAHDSGTLVVQQSAADTLPVANSGFKLVGQMVDIVYYDAKGHRVEHPTFANPIQVCLDYSADDLAKAGGQTDNFVVQFYDVGQQKWVAVPTNVDTAKGRACGSVNHLTLFALAVRTSSPDLLPQTGLSPSERSSQPSGVVLWSITLFLVALAVVLVLALRRRKSGV